MMLYRPSFLKDDEETRWGGRNDERAAVTAGDNPIYGVSAAAQPYLSVLIYRAYIMRLDK